MRRTADTAQLSSKPAYGVYVAQSLAGTPRKRRRTTRDGEGEEDEEAAQEDPKTEDPKNEDPKKDDPKKEDPKTRPLVAKGSVADCAPFWV